MTAATKTTSLLYVMPVILHNKENKVRIYAFINPWSIVTDNTSLEDSWWTTSAERNMSATCLGGSQRNRHKIYTTSRNFKFGRRWTVQPQTYKLWKTSICQSWGSTRETLPESVTTLDMSICQLWIISKSRYWLDKTTLTWSHQSVEQGPSSTPSASLFKLDWTFFGSHTVLNDSKTPFNASYCFVLQQLPWTRQWNQRRSFSLVESRDHAIGIQKQVKWSRGFACQQDT